MRNYKKSHLWFMTDLPEEIVDLIERDLSNLDSSFRSSTVGENRVIDHRQRSSKNTWVPTTHWIGGFIWHYIERVNRENFRYDISCIDSETMQYTCYNEGDFYTWHVDDNEKRLISFSHPISSGEGQPHSDYLSFETEYMRKLSFSLLLSDTDDYEGGNFQLLDGHETYFSPRKRGTLIIFDSRVPHRVKKVTKGQRKSLVGWCIGPRWK